MRMHVEAFRVCLSGGVEGCGKLYRFSVKRVHFSTEVAAGVKPREEEVFSLSLESRYLVIPGILTVFEKSMSFAFLVRWTRSVVLCVHSAFCVSLQCVLRPFRLVCVDVIQCHFYRRLHIANFLPL